MKEQNINTLNNAASQNALEKKNNDARNFVKKVDWAKFRELQKKSV